MPELDAFVSESAFEQICQRWLRRRIDAAAVGWWWGSVKEGQRSARREVDVVAIDDRGRILALGSCTWTSDRLPASEQALLQRLAPLVGQGTADPDLYFFGLNGFEPALAEQAASDHKLTLVTPSDLF